MRTLAIALLALAGCIDEFHGSNVQIDLAPVMPVQVAPGMTPGTGELPHDVHFTLYAVAETATDTGTTADLFELQRFEIHRVVELASPCFIDVGAHVPLPGVHVSQFAAAMAELKGIPDIANPPPGASEQDQIDVATAIQRQRNVLALASDAGPKVLTSTSTTTYAGNGADCADPSGFPPPTCSDAASNARRLAMCETAWAADADLYEGTDRILTAPLNGTSFGMVTGANPVNLAPIGGAQFFVDESLDDFDGFAIYWQYDDANGDGVPDYPPSVPPEQRTQLGELLLFGRPETPTRGVIHVHMTSLVVPGLTADLAVFANIHEDDVHF